MMTSFSGYWLPRAGEQLLQSIPGRSDTRQAHSRGRCPEIISVWSFPGSNSTTQGFMGRSVVTTLSGRTASSGGRPGQARRIGKTARSVDSRGSSTACWWVLSLHPCRLGSPASPARAAAECGRRLRLRGALVPGQLRAASLARQSPAQSRPPTTGRGGAPKRSAEAPDHLARRLGLRTDETTSRIA